MEQFSVSTLWYARSSYDFDLAKAKSTGARKIGLRRLITVLVRTRPRVVEINEPAQANAWPLTLLIVGLVDLLNLLPGPRMHMVSYAIDNGDLVSALSSKTRLGVPASRLLATAVTSFIYKRLTRCAFGSAGAQAQYERLARPSRSGPSTRLFPALSSPCHCLGDLDEFLTSKTSNEVVFVGSFEHRKGILHLLQAWSLIEGMQTSLRLCILGTGALAPEVIALAAKLESVEVIVEPSRAIIHQKLKIARSLVLFSQKDPRWREQLGLPILEGLSHGCTIVASTETGLASWLRTQGHVVLSPGINAELLAQEILRATTMTLCASDVIRSLPVEDARITADTWLVSATDGI